MGRGATEKRSTEWETAEPDGRAMKQHPAEAREGGGHAAKGRAAEGHVAETCEGAEGAVTVWSGETRLFIRPGFEFRIIDAMITNFHLPESTLLMLVSAFAGRENVLAAYAHAVRKRYRFFSYGDAMLVTPTSTIRVPTTTLSTGTQTP